MNVIVNGREMAVSSSTVAELLAELKIDGLTVVVEKNYDIVHRQIYETASLAAGDVIEIVRFVGGG